jgi:hypothetical protein
MRSWTCFASARPQTDCGHRRIFGPPLSGEGPQYLKVGPLVRYRTEDIEGWVADLPAGGNGRRFTVESATRSKFEISA